MNTKEDKLTKKHLAGYMFGDWGECMTFSIMGSFLTRYYNNAPESDKKTKAYAAVI